MTYCKLCDCTIKHYKQHCSTKKHLKNMDLQPVRCILPDDLLNIVMDYKKDLDETCHHHCNCGYKILPKYKQCFLCLKKKYNEKETNRCILCRKNIKHKYLRCYTCKMGALNNELRRYGY